MATPRADNQVSAAAIAAFHGAFGQLTPSGRAFGANLASQFHDKGYLTEGQVGALTKMINNLTSGPIMASEVIDISGIINLFATASGRLKHPKITLHVNGITIRLSLAGKLARFPGSINVTDLGGYGNNVWYGRIHTDGRYDANRRLPQSDITATIEALKALSLNPAQAAANHGHIHGNCCFCSLPLTDARSVSVGYGKKCASNYGLPY